jgi:hypothetical protein
VRRRHSNDLPFRRSGGFLSSASLGASREWIECYFRPEVDECVLDLKLSDGRIISAVRYCGGRLIGDSETQIDFAQWRFHESNKT